MSELHRGQGRGTSALRFVEDVYCFLEVRALHMEVERGNINDHSLCRKAGFVIHDRYLMTRRISVRSYDDEQENDEEI